MVKKYVFAFFGVGFYEFLERGEADGFQTFVFLGAFEFEGFQFLILLLYYSVIDLVFYHFL